MRATRTGLLSASVLLALTMGTAGAGMALAQGEDAVAAEEEAAEPEAAGELVEAEVVETPEAEVEAEQVESAAEEPAAQESGAAADGAVLVAPGSTDESDPGGSTKPGTTPDD